MQVAKAGGDASWPVHPLLDEGDLGVSPHQYAQSNHAFSEAKRMQEKYRPH